VRAGQFGKECHALSAAKNRVTNIALWDELIELSAARSLTQPALKSEARASIQKRADYLQETFISTLISILPFERPRLANIKFQDGDRKGETIDLTVLPDARLKQLKEITLLLTGAGAAEGSADEAHADPPRGAAPPGGDRTPKGGKKLRGSP
jgi:hypothetical protein